MCRGQECPGCLPTLAEHGLLCPWCWSSLHRVVSDVGTVLEVLGMYQRADLAASGTPPDAVARGGDPAGRTVLSMALLEADELRSMLESWAGVVVEEHPVTLRGPASGPWRGNVVAWLGPHLPWVAGQGWASTLLQELRSEVSRLRARFPWPADVERARQVPGVRCPRCDQVSLTYSPPRWAGNQFRVSCENPDCGRMFSEAEWTRLVGLLERTEKRTA